MPSQHVSQYLVGSVGCHSNMKLINEPAGFLFGRRDRTRTPAFFCSRTSFCCRLLAVSAIPDLCFDVRGAASRAVSEALLMGRFLVEEYSHFKHPFKVAPLQN